MKVLTFDGGGVRGVISGIWAAELEGMLGSPLRQHFDLIAGTSTGSLLAVGIALGIPAAEIVNIFTRDAAQAFPPSLLRKIGSRAARFFSGMGVSVPKYDGVGLDGLLKKIIGEHTFGSLPISVLIPAYDVDTMCPVVWKNWKPEHKTVLAREVARASCAAPTYLPAKTIRTNVRSYTLVDGGLFANNPAMCALVEALKQTPLDTIKLLSIGTGATMQGMEGKQVRDWGALQWAPHIIECLMDGASDVVSYQVRELLNTNFYRMQCAITNASMDDANPENVSSLIRIARKHIERPEVKQSLKAVVAMFIKA